MSHFEYTLTFGELRQYFAQYKDVSDLKLLLSSTQTLNWDTAQSVSVASFK